VFKKNIEFKFRGAIVDFVSAAFSIMFVVILETLISAKIAESMY
jgi:hypothetical protein